MPYEIAYIAADDVRDAEVKGLLEDDDPKEEGWYVFGESLVDGPHADRFGAEVVAVSHFGFQES